MAESGEMSETAALWRRWQALNRGPATPAPEPDAVLLAAYAEDRLDEAASAAVELWLAERPEALADILAARTADAAPIEVPDAVIGRAAALVAAPQATVVPFRRPQRLGWRAAVAWSGLAASLLVTSLFGFSLGSTAYSEFMGPQATEASLQDFFDPPGGLFTAFEEEAGT